MGDDEVDVDEGTPWIDRLDAAAVAASLGLLVYFVATVLVAVTTEIPEPGDMARFQRLGAATQVGSLAFGGVLLAAAGLVAARQHLAGDDERTGVGLLVASTAVIYGLSAVVAVANNVLWVPDPFAGTPFKLDQIGRGFAAILVALGALWLTDTAPNPFRARSDDLETGEPRPEGDEGDYLSR